MQAVHMNPAEAVQAHLDLEASQSIGMHFGTFRLTTEGIDEPVLALAEAVAQQRLRPHDSGLWASANRSECAVGGSRLRSEPAERHTAAPIGAPGGRLASWSGAMKTFTPLHFELSQHSSSAAV